MYEWLHNLLQDHKGDVIFTCFGPAHLIMAGIILLSIVLIVISLRNKDQKHRDRVMNILIAIPAGLYVADFFLMPFAYEMIDIEKLPFHVCTAMCVMCFLSRRIPKLAGYRVHLALLGFISNLVYVIYPAGLMWYQISPLSYRVIQTLLFHGTMTAYGIVTLLYDEYKLSFKTCYKDIIVLVCMTAWALLGNTLYNGSAGSYDHFHNWFFVVQDPFGMFSKETAPYIMPELNIVIFFAVESVVILILTLIRRASCNRP